MHFELATQWYETSNEVELNKKVKKMNKFSERLEKMGKKLVTEITMLFLKTFRLKTN